MVTACRTTPVEAPVALLVEELTTVTAKGVEIPPHPVGGSCEATATTLTGRTEEEEEEVGHVREEGEMRAVGEVAGRHRAPVAATTLWMNCVVLHRDGREATHPHNGDEGHGALMTRIAGKEQDVKEKGRTGQKNLPVTQPSTSSQDTTTVEGTTIAFL